MINDRNWGTEAEQKGGKDKMKADGREERVIEE